MLTNNDLETGKLVVASKVKVDRIFSVSSNLVRMKIGRVKTEIHEQIIDLLEELVR